MNIKNAKHVHFTGIKGVGMTSLALCCQDLGIKITGSDVEEEFVTDETLKNRGLPWKIGFKKENLNPKPDLLVFTGAHGGLNNPEVLVAKELGIPVISHAEALGQLAEGKKTIAVCGVGGKTTTCAMIATILEYAGLNPSYAIGVGNIPSTGTPGKYSKESGYFICEADEYAISPGVDNRPKFSLLSPEYLVITNIKHDHPDIYKTSEEFEQVFSEFIKRVKSYGGKVVTKSKDLLPKGFKLNVPGTFNIENANNAYAVCKLIGIPGREIINGLKKYTGCKRRFEKIAEKNGILFYDDYAHHPIQIRETLKATKGWFPDKRIVALFQPHTYSRTKALFSEFAKSFNDADFVGTVNIFASARENIDSDVSSDKLIEEIKKHYPKPDNVKYLGGLQESVGFLIKTLKPGDIFITLGAGDVYKIHKLILERI